MAEAAAPLHDPRTENVRQILDRIVTRWRQLTVQQASSRVDGVRACAQFCVDLAYSHQDGPVVGPELPHMCPAAAVDQLQVVVFDACALGHVDQLSTALTDLLARLR